MIASACAEIHGTGWRCEIDSKSLPWQGKLRGMTCHRPRATALVIACLLGACGSSLEGDVAPPGDCPALPANTAACAVDADCATVAIGCFCGAQPVNGVAVDYATEAQACEDAAANKCFRGCLTEFQALAQDGKKADRTTIAVRCDHASGATGTCKSYVP